MSFPSKEEIRRACASARGLGFSIEPRLTLAGSCCCPLGAVLIARGLQGEWEEGISDWTSLARLLGCDPEAALAFTNAYEGVPGASHPLVSELPAEMRRHLPSAAGAGTAAAGAESVSP